MVVAIPGAQMEGSGGATRPSFISHTAEAGSMRQNRLPLGLRKVASSLVRLARSKCCPASAYESIAMPSRPAANGV